MINSKQKGKRVEREWRDELIRKGFPARRGVQYCGDPTAPDVVCESLPFHWECKGDERLNVHKAIDQAIRDCPHGKWRAVAHKKNRTGWIVSMPSEDFFDLVKEWYDRT